MAKQAKKAKPSGNGRNGKGQFSPGNTLANGRGGHKSRSQATILKSELCNAVTRKDINDIALGLIKKAKTGDVLAARELFDRLWGKAPQSITGEDGGPIAMVMLEFDGLCTEAHQ